MESIKLTFANEEVKKQWYAGRPAPQVDARHTSVRHDVANALHGKVNASRMETRQTVTDYINSLYL